MFDVGMQVHLDFSWLGFCTHLFSILYTSYEIYVTFVSMYVLDGDDCIFFLLLVGIFISFRFLPLKTNFLLKINQSIVLLKLDSMTQFEGMLKILSQNSLLVSWNICLIDALALHQLHQKSVSDLKIIDKKKSKQHSRI